MSEKIKSYYQNRVLMADEKDFLWQVGKTVSGKVISDFQVELIVDSIKNNLCLGQLDKVLDIGCGNGYITRKIADLVGEVVGVDFSDELLGVAKKSNCDSNISYLNYNILSEVFFDKMSGYNKVYLYEVVQHMDYSSLGFFFKKIHKVLAEQSVVYIGGVLDEEKKWAFYDTFERRCELFETLCNGVEPIGYWCHRDFIIYLAKKNNFTIKILPQPSQLYTSHYRFDCVLKNSYVE